MLTENEIRPKDMFEEYLRLSKIDGDALSKNDFQEIRCPACESTNVKLAFKKNEFTFKKCIHCKTLFCSPRPSAAQLNDFYKKSISAKYWSTTFLPQVAEKRKEKLIKPKAQEVIRKLEQQNLSPASICDVGASHGFFLDELARHFKSSKFYAIEPEPNSCDILISKGFSVSRDVLGDDKSWNGKMNFVTCFEVLEHVYSPRTFMKDIFDLCAPGGQVLITTLNCEGYDIFSLKEKSNSISPPHHLNFMSYNGFLELFTNIGFSDVEIETPGKLDVDILLNSGEPNEFLELLKSRGHETLNNFQEFLVNNKLSSHTWIWAKK